MSGHAPRDEQGNGCASGRKPAPGLYIVATPIGHADDITLRALHILGAADLVACEDTRHSRRLLARHGIRARLTSYHDHNAERAVPRLLAALADGAVVALISDAGTPLISDPGYRLVAAAAEAGYPVVPVPGPSAVLAALSVAGLPTDRFLFAGFLPSKAAARRRVIAELAPIPATLVILESPRRVAATLADLADRLGARPAVLARELTKMYETVRRAPLPELAAALAGEPTPKGEIVLVIGPPDKREATLSEDAQDPERVDALLRTALETLKTSAAATTVARATGLPRSDLYRRATQLKDAAPTADDDIPA